MSTESHLSELERRHADLERQLNEAMSHPSADTLELTDLKRRKLRLKDEIAKLKGETTVH
jgi:hypothetical protein